MTMFNTAQERTNHKKHERLVRKMKYMLCLDDPKSIKFKGNRDSRSSNTINLLVQECTKKATCKTKEEIREFASRNSLYLMKNRKEYRPTEYGEHTIANDLDELNLPLDFNRGF